MTIPQFETNLGAYESCVEYAKEFYTILAGTGYVFKRKDGSITFVDEASGPRRIIGLDEFRAMAGSLLDLRRGVNTGRGRGDTPALLDRDEAVHLFGSPERGRLPELEYVLHEPAVATYGGRPHLIDQPGYHPEALAYYWRRPGAAKITPLDTTTHLEKCFSGVPFLSEEYRNNVFAWLVGGMTLDDVNTPMMTVTGNDRGVGKSSLVQACGFILTGHNQNAIRSSGEEFEKQLGAKFAAEERFVMLDNITTTGNRSYKNSKLASLLTEGRSKQVRRLGQSRHITQTGVLFALTANDCKLDQDLATRSLMVALYRETPGPMKPYVLTYAKEHREELYGELLGLALARDSSFKIPEVYDTCRFVDWVQYVVPIVTPRFGDLAIKEAEDLDDRIQDLFGWGTDRVDKVFTLGDLYTEIVGAGDGGGGLPGLWSSLMVAKSERARRIKLGRFVNTIVGKSQLVAPDLTIQLQAVGVVDPKNKRKGFKFSEV
jgi:hypothetical protein